MQEKGGERIYGFEIYREKNKISVFHYDNDVCFLETFAYIRKKGKKGKETEEILYSLAFPEL